MEESMDDLTTSFLSIFNTYYDDVDDDYSDVPILESNPDYKSWIYFEDRSESA